MSTRTQELAIYHKIREIQTVDEIERRLAVIHDNRASPGRPYPDEVRWLCRQRLKLEGKR